MEVEFGEEPLDARAHGRLVVRRPGHGSEETSKGNTAAMAVDGSTTTRWSASNGTTGQWLKVDLGSAKSLTGTRIAWEKDATNYRYKIEGSTGNSTWTTLADLTATTSSSQVQVALFTAQARYVRVTVTGLPSGAWASIRNLEIYDRTLTTDLGTLKLVIRKSSKVLDVNGASTADGASVIQWPGPGAARWRTRIGAWVQPERADKKTPRTCTSECFRIRDVCYRAILDRIWYPECPDMPHGQQTETTIPAARIRPGFDPEGLFSQ
ncbi:discoidin domain-containing protein [Streptomyces sp. NPDC014995]|uniref:discoidin domain-containing protein n=1 Tax=Streptomyces sp. NPDC014995 TaxID=3364936 RepID=UPI0037030B52